MTDCIVSPILQMRFCMLIDLHSLSLPPILFCPFVVDAAPHYQSLASSVSLHFPRMLYRCSHTVCTTLWMNSYQSAFQIYCGVAGISSSLHFIWVVIIHVDRSLFAIWRTVELFRYVASLNRAFMWICLPFPWVNIYAWHCWLVWLSIWHLP
jgi:hypothetical protein